MRYKIIGFFMVVVFALAATAGVSTALNQGDKKPVIEGSITYDPVTVHADVVDMADLDEMKIYFRYRQKGRKGWTRTEKRTMNTEGTYSKILTDIDPDVNYEFQVVVEWIGEEDLIFETEKKPAEFEFRNLRTVPKEIYVDEHTNFKVDVENVGGQKGETTVDFVVNDGTEISKTVEIEPGKTETVSASYVPEEKGKYDVEGMNMTTSFRAYDLPSVEAKHATSVTHNSAELVAELTNIGLEESVEVYFKYKTGEGDWIETEKKEMESEGEFSQKIKDLDMDSDYRFRAVVQWDGTEKVGEAQFIESQDIVVKPNAVVDEELRGVNDIGVFFWGEGMSISSDIAEYRWDFDGDGEWEYVDEENGRIVHVYNETGTYDAVFEVEDDEGKIDSEDVEVIIRERSQPLYKIEESADGVTRDVYFVTDYFYDEDEDETRVSINVKNSVKEDREVRITVDVPGDVVSSFENMETFPRPTEILEKNPKVRWNFTLKSGETGRIEMAFDGHVKPSEFDDMKMIQAYGKDERTRRTVTGLLLREISRVWGFLVIVIIAILLVLIFTSRRGRDYFSRTLSKFEEVFLIDEEEKTSSERKIKGKRNLDRRFIETARRAKKALKRNEVTNPHNIVDSLERANQALEKGDVNRFEQYIGEVENEMKYGIVSNNVVS